MHYEHRVSKSLYYEAYEKALSDSQMLKGVTVEGSWHPSFNEEKNQDSTL